jgi:hypothetical protein
MGLSQILTHCFISQLVTVCPYIAQYMIDLFLFKATFRTTTTTRPTFLASLNPPRNPR